MKNNEDTSNGIIFWLGVIFGFALCCLVFMYKDIPNTKLIENGCGYFNTVNGKFTWNDGEIRQW